MRNKIIKNPARISLYLEKKEKKELIKFARKNKESLSEFIRKHFF